MEAKKLGGVEIIKEPRGLAVDSLRKIIYIVDGNGGSPALYAARMYNSKDGNVACEAPKIVAEGLSSDWVAVDFRGKVFFVSNNQILSMPVAVVTNKLDGAPMVSTDAVAGVLAADSVADSATSTEDSVVKADSDKMDKRIEIVYDGGKVNGVSMPLGLAVDGYKLFWSNSENGKKDGAVVQGMESPLGDEKVNPLATNIAMAHGVCLTSSRVFYTDEENNVFSTKVNGGPIAAVTDKLQKPRGCVFDGDGTVFVADQGDDKIVSFAGAGAELGPRRLSLALSNVKEPFGLAVLHGRETFENGAPRSAAIAMATIVSIFGFLL